MGIVFGKITVATPKYEVVRSTGDYEIRQYSPWVAAEVTYDPAQLKGNKDGGFTILANYIGALGSPCNSKAEKMAMTAPVLTSKAEKVAMTALVLRADEEGVRMQFILPEKYRRAEEAPKPVDERVVIKEEGERKYGVVEFSGVASQALVKDKADKLKRDLERDGYTVARDFVLARYNPPWTLPPFRTNQVMIPVE